MTFVFPDSSFGHTDKFLYSFQVDTTETDSVDKDDKGLPLDPARMVSLTTHEGTWMSVDVHPSGEKIIFDMMGNLYTIPIEGGEATQITEGMAYDAHPRYSPNGKYVLFISDRSGGANVWYMNVETGETFQVTEGKNNRYPSAAWSPNGEYIVAAKGGLTNKLWMYHRDGGSGVQLVDEPEGLKMIDPVFGPEGRFIYYSRRMGGWEYNAQLPQYQIGVYDRENASTSVITSRYGSAFTPTISPDGKWMVYGSRYEDQTGLVIRNLETGEERWLAYPVQRDDQESIATNGVLPGMSFTPDSEALIATYGGKLWRIPVNSTEGTEEIAFTVDLDIKLGPLLDFEYPISDKKMKVATQIRDAVPSPDGDQLAFTVLNRLYVMELPGGEPHRVTDMNVVEAQPAWSPDGEWIVYATWSSEEGGHLYKVQPDGDDLTRLTEQPAIYGNPAWSFNSDRIVFLRGSAQSFRNGIGPGAFFGSMEDIAWIPGDGGEIHFIAKTAGRTNPHFVKYNNRIYLNDDNVLLSIRWDGSDVEKYAKVTGITTSSFFSNRGPNGVLHPVDSKENGPEPSEASLIKVAPEGNWALAKINNAVYAFIIPQVGDMIKVSLDDPEDAAFPARKLTEIGGQFPVWADNGKVIHWSIGNAHMVYDLERALAVEDSVQAAKKDKEEEKEAENGEKDDEEKADEEPAYEPKEYRVKVMYEQDIPEGVLLLKNARLITMDGNEVIEHGDILIEDNRIRAVGKTGTLDVPAGAEVMDMTGKTIIPGFVDTHAHMWPTWGIHKDQVWKYWANLAYGVTTTRDPQTATTDVLTYSDMVDAGKMLGPRVYSTGPGLGYWAYNIQSLEHAKNVMKQYSEYYDTQYIKMYIAGNRQQRQWIIMAAKEQKILPTTEGALDWRLNMTQLIDGYPGQEHNLPIYPIYKDVLQVTAEAKMAVTPTLLVTYGGPWAENYFYSKYTPYDNQKLRYFTPYPELASKSRRRGFWAVYDEYMFYNHSKFIKKLVNAGGLAGIGSHGQLNGLGYHWELWAVHSGGMSNYDALRVATIIGAKALGLESDLGSIEAGKLADLIILNKNPLKDIHNTTSIEYVMKNGRLYEAATLDEIYPQSRPAPDHWWGDKKPKKSLPGIGGYE
ncbi:MAG TPA: amidohydrolase family protein [Balneolaceae bacterium]